MGQLTNQYVSSSYQGLLKMTDSTQGVTGTLQTVQTGDGTNTPLQISQTEINISGSLTLNGAPISFDTGSFATTGSNTFIGDQTISGSIKTNGNIQWSESSFNYLDKPSGSLYFSTINNGTLHLNDDGGEGDVFIGWGPNKTHIKGDTDITGSLGVTNIKGTGSLLLQPNQSDARYLEVYNTSPTDTHITGSGGQIFIGDDVTYVKVDNYGSVERIDIVAGNELVVSSSIVNLSGSLHQSGTFYPDVIDWFSSSIVQNTGSYILTTDALGVTQYDSYANVAIALGQYSSSGTSGTSGTSGQDGSSGTSGSSGISNSFFNYQAKTVSFNAPGSGYITWNQSPQTGATFLNVSDQDQSNNNVDIFLGNLGSGSVITIQDKTNQSNYQVWQLGTKTDNTTYWTYAVTLVSATHQFSGNDNILFIITTTPSGTSGSSGTSGINGSSGTSGSSGQSGSSGTSGNGSSGTSGSSGLTDKTGLITTGSLGLVQGITGSISEFGGNIYIAQSGGNTQQFNYTGSGVVVGGNIIMGFPSGSEILGYTQSQLSASMQITGSNNILIGGPQPNDQAPNGNKYYVNGFSNIFNGFLPSINTGSLLSPLLYQNYFGGVAPNFIFSTSSLGQPTINNNMLLGGMNVQHNSGSVTINNNMGPLGVTSLASITTLSTLPTIQNNFVVGSTGPLNHNSSSILYTQNIGGMTVNNNYSSSVSAAVNNITVSQNIIIGSQNTLTVTGSNTANRRTFNSNLIAGRVNLINSNHSGSSAGHLIATSILGQNLIVSASNTSTTLGGSTFLGRFNATGSLQESSQEAVFVVGTGTGAAARRNAIHVDSNNNTRITGSLLISGSMNLTGSVNLSTILTLAPQNPLPTGTTGSLAVSGSLIYFNNGTSWVQMLTL